MMRRKSVELDESISRSWKSRAVQYSTQLGGALLAGYSGFKMGDIETSQNFFLGGVATGIGSTLFGTIVGLERGSATHRNEDRIISNSMGVEPVGLTKTEHDLAAKSGIRAFGIPGPIGVTLFSAVIGLGNASKELQTQSIPFPPNWVTIPMAGAAAIAMSLHTAPAGETYNMPPIIHRTLHL